MKFMLSQSLAQVPVKYVSVQFRGGRYRGTIQYVFISFIIQNVLMVIQAFYLRPQEKPNEDVWYTHVPVGHNILGTVVSCLCT